jgi:hypothetical protein
VGEVNGTDTGRGVLVMVIYHPAAEAMVTAICGGDVEVLEEET